MCKLLFIKMILNYYLYIILVYVYFKVKKKMGDYKNYIVMNYNRSLILFFDKNLIIVNGLIRE